MKDRLRLVVCSEYWLGRLCEAYQLELKASGQPGPERVYLKAMAVLNNLDVARLFTRGSCSIVPVEENRIFRCVEGLPPGSEWVGVCIFEGEEKAEFLFSHPSFAEVERESIPKQVVEFAWVIPAKVSQYLV